MSAMRGSLEIPMTSLSGMYPICIWCFRLVELELPVSEMRVYLAGEWDHVVLAHGENLDILHNDELVVALVEDSFVDEVLDVLLVPLSEKEHGLCVAVWSSKEPLTVWVLSQALEDSSHSTSQLLLAFQCLLWRLF